MYIKECKWCKNIIEVEKQPLFALHVANCKNNPNLEIRKKNYSIKFKGILKVERIKLNKICSNCSKEFEVTATESEIKRNRVKNFCSRSCANVREISEKTKKKISNSLTGTTQKNRREINNNVEFICLKCGEIGIDKNYNKKRMYHKDCWIKISGGIKNGSSRGKSGWYKGFWCDSSYELAYLIYCLDNNIKIERNKKGFKYTFKNKDHLFYPDFIVNGEYVEIKNYRSEMTDSKIESFPYDIEVYYKEEMQKYLSYLIEKYGKNFISLYE
jgi:hypothetical protein